MRGSWGDRAARRRAGVAALLVVAAMTIVAVHVRAYPEVSPIDELQHIDYLDKAAHGELVGRGERVGTLAMREEACRGLDAPVAVPPCDARVLRPTQFQENGFNTAYIHPPTYYAVSGLIGRATRSITGMDSLVTAGRLTGALWLGAAVALLWLALGDLGARPASRATLLVLLITSPTVLHASATVNPDAMALAAGAALLLSVLRWEAGRWPAWVPVLLGAGAVLVKATNVVAVGAALLYLAVRQIDATIRARSSREPAGDDVEGTEVGVVEERRTQDRAATVVLGGLLVGAVALVSVAWVGLQGALAERPVDEIPMLQRFEVDSISGRDIVGQLGAGVSPLREPYLPGVLRSRDVITSVKVVDAAWVAGVVIAAVYVGVSSRRRALALASLVAMAAVGPLFVLVNFVFSGTFVEIPARYGLSMVPFALAAISVALERRPLLIGAAAYAGWLVVITAVPLITV